MNAREKAYLVAFGNNLKKLMESRKKTPDDVAALGYLETKQVYRVINAEHSSTITVLCAIAKGLDVKMKTLFDFDYEENVAG